MSHINAPHYKYYIAFTRSAPYVKYMKFKEDINAWLNVEPIATYASCIHLLALYIIFIIQIHVFIWFNFYMFLGGGWINVYGLYTTLGSAQLNYVERLVVTMLHGERWSNFRNITIKKEFGQECWNVVGLFEDLFRFIFKNFDGLRAKHDDIFAELMLGDVGVCGRYYTPFNTLPVQTNFKTNFWMYIFNNFDSLNTPCLFNFCEFMLGDEQAVISKPTTLDGYSWFNKVKLRQIKYVFHLQYNFRARLDIIYENAMYGREKYADLFIFIFKNFDSLRAKHGNIFVELMLRDISVCSRYYTWFNTLPVQTNFKTNFWMYIFNNFDSLNTPCLCNFCEFMLGDEQALISKPTALDDYSWFNKVKLRQVKYVFKLQCNFRARLDIIYENTMYRHEKYTNYIQRTFK